jgi:hypothetical protein
MAVFLYVLTATGIVLLVRRTRRVSSRAAMALLLLPLAFTWRALLTGDVYAPIDLAYTSEPLASLSRSVGVTQIAAPALSDVTTQFIPWNAALRWSLAHREWPLWNPFALCGSVLAAAAQSAPYHPVTLLSLLLPQPDALTFIAAMTYFLAALSAFLFLRAICASELAAFFGAAGWCFSQYLVSFILTAHGAAIAVLPLVLFGAHEIVRNPSRRSVVTLVIAATLMTLCGHPETLLYTAILTVAFVAVLTRRNFVAVWKSIALAAAATILLTAIFTAPLLDAIPQTFEYRFRVDIPNKTNGWGVVLHMLRADVVPLTEGIAGIEMPDHPPELRHPWPGTPYAGAILFAPILYAFWRARSRLTWFFAAVILFALLAGAQAPILTGLLNHLPLFNIAVNARMIVFAAFGICALAAIGIDAWITHGGPLDLLNLAAVVPIMLIGLNARGELSASFLRVGLARETIPLLLAFACLRAARSSRTATVCLVALLLLQRVWEAGSAIPTINRRAFFPSFPGLELIKRDSPFRVIGQGVLFTPNTAAEYALEDARGYEAMTFGRLADTLPLWSVPQPVWSNRIDDLASPFLSLLNVRYAFVLPGAKIPQTWARLGHFSEYDIAENKRVLPRAFVPAIVHTGRGDTLREMAACRDLGSEAWIETDGVPATRPNGRGQIEVLSRGNDLLIHARMDDPGWVVVSNTAWKGWRVFRGVERLKIRFADHAFVGFYLPRGEHEVAMQYRPRAFVYGAVITYLTVLFLTFVALAQVGLLASRGRRPARHGIAPTPISTSG